MASQRSEVSTLATDLSPTDNVSEISNGSPGNVRSIDVDMEGRTSAELSGHPLHLPRPPVQGGGTWLGGISHKALNEDINSHIPSHLSAVSSPGIHAAMAGLRGEEPLVRLMIKLNKARLAEFSSSEAISEGKKNTCHNSRVLCRLGLCKCERQESQQHQGEEPGKLVSVSFIVGGGLGTCLSM